MKNIKLHFRYLQQVNLYNIYYINIFTSSNKLVVTLTYEHLLECILRS